MRFESLHEPTAKRRRSEDMTTTRVFAPCKIPTNNFKDILELRKLLELVFHLNLLEVMLLKSQIERSELSSKYFRLGKVGLGEVWLGDVR